MESIVAGVPMICWPRQSDQQVHSRREELVNAADEKRKLAIKSVGEGGSSYCNFDRLIGDIYKMNEKPCMPSGTNEYVVDKH
ncbi:hypothetical protein FNV43_RR01174 [Rhamnella rubrinervis]|uniref:Uncharacterized protein n=1 Tax=Rhamnella rubrinervis TaxID=2594499 RepID=A0A8K0HPX5_9ROSA|nr:hypothetical protein FNV43_RR01174 [Rhamnella rubrinervis]